MYMTNNLFHIIIILDFFSYCTSTGYSHAFWFLSVVRVTTGRLLEESRLLLHLVGALGRRYRFGGGFELQLVVHGNVVLGAVFHVFRDGGRRGRHDVGHGLRGDVGGPGCGRSGRGRVLGSRRRWRGCGSATNFANCSGAGGGSRGWCRRRRLRVVAVQRRLLPPPVPDATFDVVGVHVCAQHRYVSLFTVHAFHQTVILEYEPSDCVPAHGHTKFNQYNKYYNGR